MSTLSPEAVLVPRPDVFLREEGKEGGFLYDPNSGGVRLVNGSAASVWKLLDGRRTLGEVIEGLQREYAGFDEAAAAEVVRLAGELLAVGLVGLHEARPGP